MRTSVRFGWICDVATSSVCAIVRLSAYDGAYDGAYDARKHSLILRTACGKFTFTFTFTSTFAFTFAPLLGHATIVARPVSKVSERRNLARDASLAAGLFCFRSGAAALIERPRGARPHRPTDRPTCAGRRRFGAARLERPLPCARRRESVGLIH